MNFRETSTYLKTQLTAIYSESEADAIVNLLWEHLLGADRVARE